MPAALNPAPDQGTATSAVIRILIGDDHPVVRDGLSAVLATQPDFAVIAEAGDGLAVVAQAALHRPDIILLDLEMPGQDGVAALRQLRAADPELRVIVFTAFDTDERILEALRAGAAGYLLKGAPRDELFRAIRVVHQGGTLLAPLVASRLVAHLQSPPPDPSAELTPRETEVLRLLARGLANKEIAATLGIRERTVKFHVSAILAKLGAGNRTEAVAVAAGRGMVEM